MAIDKETKKKVIEDWQNAFPALSLYAQNKLYKVVGPVLIGLELMKMPYNDDYRPYFVAYSLLGNKQGNDVKACLDWPFFLQEYSDKKSLQYNIPYERHHIFFNDAVESVKKQTPLPFDHNISFKEMESAIDRYSKKRPLGAAPNSYLQAVLQETRLKIALYIDVSEAHKVLEQIHKRTWDENHFKAFQIDLKDWLQSLQVTASNRDALLRQVEINRQEKKIARLKSSELTV